MHCLIRTKIAEMLNRPQAFVEAKSICERVCLDRDVVVFDPKSDHVETFVILLCRQGISYTVEFVDQVEHHDQLREIDEISVIG